VTFLSPVALLPGNIHRVEQLMSFPSMQVTKEDGGRLNAFATEPRMVVMEAGNARGGANKVLLIGGLALVAVLLAVAALISRTHA
jgi:hypothetical protein